MTDPSFTVFSLIRLTQNDNKKYAKGQRQKSGDWVVLWSYNVIFTNNTSGKVITTGNIVQSAPSAGAQTVTLTSDTGKSFNLGTQITDDLGHIGVTYTNSVVKEGAGTAMLTVSNTCSGTAAINAGVLSIAASASTGSGAVAVNNTGTKLMGTGTVGGKTTVNSGAILAPGDAGVGKESFSGNLTTGSGSIFEWELAANRSRHELRRGGCRRHAGWQRRHLPGGARRCPELQRKFLGYQPHLDGYLQNRRCRQQREVRVEFQQRAIIQQHRQPRNSHRPERIHRQRLVAHLDRRARTHHLAGRNPVRLRPAAAPPQTGRDKRPRLFVTTLKAKYPMCVP
ncbi:MAG: hypothetical protein WCP35_18815 [Verrucomicrobiota bacterium]